MGDYRSLDGATGDEDAAALADLGRTMQRVRIRLLVPGLLLTFLAGAVGGVMHASGALAFVRASDGSYLVNKATLLVYTLLSAAVIAVPWWGLYRLVTATVRRRWEVAAPGRFRISVESAAEFAAMFR